MPDDDIKEFTEADLEDNTFKVTVLTQLGRLKPIEDKLVTMNGRCAERLEMIHAGDIAGTRISEQVVALKDNVVFWRRVLIYIAVGVGSLATVGGGVLAYMKVVNGG